MSLPRRFSISLASLLLGSAALPLGAATIGYYQFEDTPGVLEDSSAANRDLTQTQSPNGQVASPFGSVSNPPAGSATNTEAMSFSVNGGFTAVDADYADLTVEAFVNLTSASGDGQARVFAAQFGTTGTTRAFNFGVAGNTSSTFTDNNTLFLQVANAAGAVSSIDTGFRLTTGVNYYLAASINAGALNAGADGQVTFYLKDLTNAGTLQTATKTVTGFNAFYDPTQVFTIGSSSNGTTSRWDGIIDEVRFSDVALTSDQLLVAIPEPSSVALILGGLVFVGVIARRQRNVR